MRFILFFLVFLISSISSIAQKYSAEQAKADLQFTYDVLKQAHPSVFRYTKEEEFDWVFDYLNRGIVDSITKNELGEKINTLMATVRCVHTSATNTLVLQSKNFFNFNILIHNGNLYAKNVKELLPDTSWMKIISINNIPSIEIVSRMLMLKSGDGNVQTFTNSVIASNFNTFFNAFYNVPTICVVEFETKNGLKKIPIERTIKYTAKNLSYQWADWQKTDTSASVYFLKNKNIKDVRVLKISSFKKINKAFYADAFQKMKKDSVKTILIDLRANTGGNIYHAFDLLSHLIPSDIYMYAERKKNTKLGTRLKFKGYTQWVLSKFLYDVLPQGQRWSENGLKKYRYEFKSKKDKDFNPEIFVWIDGKSVSSSSLLASYLKLYTKAKFIGEESGGTIAGNNGRAYPEIITPHSGMKLRVPLHHITYHLGYPDAGRGVQVDYPLSIFLTEKDEKQFIQNLLLQKE